MPRITRQQRDFNAMPVAGSNKYGTILNVDLFPQNGWISNLEKNANPGATGTPRRVVR